MARSAGSGSAPRHSGALVLVLHAHLPDVRDPDHARSLEEAWFFEAVADCYLPLLGALERLVADGVPVRLTLSLSPTLVALMQDAPLLARCSTYLGARCELGRREVQRAPGERGERQLARFYLARARAAQRRFDDVYGRDLISPIAALARAGALELLTTSATHAFLPFLASHPRALRLQISAALEDHRRVFGRRPEGFWLPECGYVPGLSRVLAGEGLRYTFLDTAALRGTRLGCYAPIQTDAGLAVFAREAEASDAVWSAASGYPAHRLYRDFYRDIGFSRPAAAVPAALRPGGQPGFTGFKYAAVTGPTGDKVPYRPGPANRQAQRHAADFAGGCRERLARALSSSPVIVAPFDAELFGHWWFEGPVFLEALARECARAGPPLCTAADVLKIHPPKERLEPPFSTWGRGGDARTWLNPKTDSLVAEVDEATAELEELLPRGRGKLGPIAQAAREVLLAQASDWPFLVDAGPFAGYAAARVREHLSAFERLRREPGASASRFAHRPFLPAL